MAGHDAEMAVLLPALLCSAGTQMLEINHDLLYQYAKDNVIYTL